MKISLVQFNVAYLDVDTNLERVNSLVGNLKTDLLVLPELFATGYFFESMDHVLKVAEPSQGRTFEFARDLSKRTGATIVYGYPEKEGGELFNSAATVSEAGLLNNYRKTHLYYKEKHFFQPGDTGFTVTPIEDRSGLTYNLGVMICFDWYYPESIRTLALQGADIVAHPSNLVRKNCPRSMPVRALENRVFTVTSNRIGAEGEVSFIGQSVICNPIGEVLTTAGRETEEVLTVEIDVTQARGKQLTSENNLFDDRRPELYRLG